MTQRPGKRLRPDDWDDVKPSPVVHVRDLAPHTLEIEVIRALENYGNIKDVSMIPNRGQALVEFDDVSMSQDLLDSTHGHITVNGHPAKVNFSTSQRIIYRSDPAFYHKSGAAATAGVDEYGEGSGSDGSVGENKVLMCTIYNAIQSITIDIIEKIFGSHGRVLRIMMFRKAQLQVMVEFGNVDEARRAKQNLNGADIYSNCCTLKIEYAKPSRINVTRNDQDSWDFEAPEVTAEPAPEYKTSNSLLGDPTPGSMPNAGYPGGFQQPGMGGNYNMPPQAGRGCPPLQMMRPPGIMGGPPGGAAYPGGFSRPVMPGSFMPPTGAPPYQNFGGNPQGPGFPGPPQAGYNPSGMYQSGPPGNQFPGGGGPQQFPGGQQGNYQGGRNAEVLPGASAVMLVYGLSAEKMNCDKLFNILCLYGNVVRIKFLKSKEGGAMVQMSDVDSCHRVLDNLNGTTLFDKRLQIHFSKQQDVTGVPNPYSLEDGTPSFKDFSSTKLNRFTNPEQAAKNRVIAPTKTLHYWNCPPDFSEDQVRMLFVNADIPEPERFMSFSKGGDKQSSGLVEWNKHTDALEAVAAVNHVEIQNADGRYPYSFKLCFSHAPIKDKSQHRGADDINADDNMDQGSQIKAARWSGGGRGGYDRNGGGPSRGARRGNASVGSGYRGGRGGGGYRQ